MATMVERSCHRACEYSCLSVNLKTLLTNVTTTVLKEESQEFGLDLKVRGREANCSQEKNNWVPANSVEIGS